MLQQLFHIAQPTASVNASLASAKTPFAIVTACMNQLLSQVQKKDKELRDLIQDVIDSLPRDDEDHHLDEIVVDDKFHALYLACTRSGQPKLTQSALSVIDKLVSSGLLVGDAEATDPDSLTPESSGPPSDTESIESSRRTAKAPKKLVMNSVIGAVFQAARSNDDEETHLLAVRCVLSCVLSKNHAVHRSALLTSIRTCYLIIKDSKSVSAQTTATTALSQIINCLTSRLKDKTNNITVSEDGPILSDWAASYGRNLINKTVLLTFPDNEEDDDRGRMGWCVVCNSSGDYFCRQSREAVCSMLCKKKNLLRLKRASMNKHDSSTSAFEEYNDLVTVFKSLCKLSSGAVNLSDQRLVRSKILSLELISLILVEASSYLKTDAVFSDIIKRILFDSLLTNSVSPIGKVFTTALDIFAILLNEYNSPDRRLLREIGVFINQVFLYILQSENSSFTHKKKVLEIFSISIFSNEELIVDLFANFDCCIDQPNVIELSLNAFRSLLVGTGTKKDINSTIEETSTMLKKLSLNCFVSLLNCMSVRASKQQVGNIEDTAECEKQEAEEVDVEVSVSVVAPKQRKLILQQGVELFKAKPNKGIKFLIEHQFIESKSPPVVARALCEFQPPLDKTAIGDFIGDNKPFNLECFYALVERMHFENQELDVSLRSFLSHFRLPGEAQKIDRIMEKFAEKFTNDNPGRYANADAAYVLSFAVIMLNTDLHSPQIKKKMTIEEFVKLGKGINTEIEIPQSELERLYRHIQADAISLSEDDELRKKLTLENSISSSKEKDEVSLQRKKFDLFMKETEQMIQRTKETLLNVNVKAKEKKESPDASSYDFFRELLRVAHPSLLASFKEALVLVDLETIAETVRLGIFFEIELVKTDFLNLLFDLANINLSVAQTNVSQNQAVEAISKILTLAVSHGNGLSSGICWTQVVRILSLIDKVGFLMKKGGSETEISNCGFFSEAIATESIDLIISNSPKLSPVNILSLTSALISVSLESELCESPPRLFCAQKLVELADFNMGKRIRLVWSKIWSLISPFFVKISQFSDSGVSMLGIDSLRQLAFKFLSKQELGNYHFQSEFMRPFHVIMTTKSLETHQLILSVIESLVKQVSENLKSGWISVFACLQVASSHQSEQNLLAHATDILKQIESCSFKGGALVKCENFRAFAACLNALIANKASTDDIRNFAWTALENHIAFLKSAQDPAATSSAGEITSHWMSVFKSLSLCMSDIRSFVHEKAISILFESIFINSIEYIDGETTQIFLRAVLIPWLDDLLHSIGDGIPIELGMALILQTSESFNKVIKAHFEDRFHKYMLEILNFNLLLAFFDRSDKIAQLGLANIRSSLIGNVRFQDMAKFDQVVEGCIKLISGTIPEQLLENTNLTTLASLPFNPERIVSVCSTHLNVIQLIGDLIDSLASEGNQIGEPQLAAIAKLMDALSRSRDFASRFNAEIPLREKYKALGFMRDLKQLPGLLKQERAASTVSLKILFLVELNSNNFDSNNEKLALCRSKLRIVCNDLVDSYVAKETKLGTVAVQIRDTLIDEIERDINGLVPLINSVIIGGFEKMAPNEFFANREWIFEILLKLVKVNNASIRANVSVIMNSRIKPILARN